MKKVIGFVISLVIIFKAIPIVEASVETPAQLLNEQYKELYASDLAYVDNVYKNEGKKVKDIPGVNAEIKDAIGNWKVEKVSENGGSVQRGFEAIVLKSPDSIKNEYIIAYKGSAGTLSDKDWVDNQEAINYINSDKTQVSGLVYHPQDEEADSFTKSFLDKISNQNNNEIILTGHSLGGHLAQHVKIALNQVGMKVVTFNSLGVVTNSKQANYEPFLSGNSNFIIDGEIVDSYNTIYAITNLGTIEKLYLNSDYPMDEKHKLIRFYSFINKTFSVYQNNKLVKSFYDVNNAVQLASLNNKTAIVDASKNRKLIWESKYAVYFHQKFLSSFNDRKSSDSFANKQAGRRVIDTKTNKNVYFKTNSSFRYSVYLGKDKLDIFTNSKEAISYAKLNKNRVVKDEKTKKTIYPVKK
ncbi:DUF6792 domain-containing protein [Gottfriedia luciferensis]|uniref:DUF6792 domain-containing protein n=1 Tax=Gottfriedia luciferensis TaxID=178774 RepID=UPI000B447C9E|nr:DUF6792 domain-containing protein [Gottfriedia luciferensis]